MAKKKKRQNNSNNSSSFDYEKAYQETKSALQFYDKRFKKIDKNSTVSRGLQYDSYNNVNYNNIVYPRNKVPDIMLCEVEKRNGIVGAITTLRIQQAIEYSQISHDKDIPGWEFVLIDDKKTITPEQEKQKRFLEDFLKKTHIPDYKGLITKNSNIRELLVKYVRDRLLIDKVTWEIERDRAGRAVAISVLDGKTILPVLPGGYYGPTTSIGVIGFRLGFGDLAKEIEKARLENVPDLEDISYVQELWYGSSGGGIAAAFAEDDIVYDIANELNDIRSYKQGFSVTEKAVVAVTAFINSLTYNSNGLAEGAIPKIAISMGKDSNYTTEQLQDAQDEWIADFNGVDGQWNIPMLNGDAKILNLLPNNRDMEYQKFMEFVGALICSEMGADPAEAGLRLNQAQNVLSENQDAKQVFSKNRGTREILNGFAFIVNSFLQKSNWSFADDFCFRFNGLGTEDRGYEADLDKKAIESYEQINELRKKRGLPPDPYGDIIANPQYIQYRLQKEQMESMQQEEGGEEFEEEEGGFGEFSEKDVDNTVDDVMDELDMEKSVRLV
jgi:hypothetical protein